MLNILNQKELFWCIQQEQRLNKKHKYETQTERIQIGKINNPHPGWPDVGLKISPKFSQSYQKIAPAVTIHFGYFCVKLCHQELAKIARSGHTESDSR